MRLKTMSSVWFVTCIHPKSEKTHGVHRFPVEHSELRRKTEMMPILGSPRFSICRLTSTPLLTGAVYR